MLKNILLVLLIAILVLGVFWVGLSIYGNFSCSSKGGTLEPPSEASYRAIFEATGEVIFINNIPEQVTESYAIAHGYWEFIDGGYKHRNIDLILDEEVAGNIKIEALK